MASSSAHMSPVASLDDLWAVAVHEAGHAVVAEKLTGVPATITLERRRGNGSSWIKGECHHVRGPDARSRAMISLAGAVAETLFASDQAGNTGDALFNPIARRVSSADLANSGLTVVRPTDVDAAIQIVWPLRSRIEERARCEVARFERAVAA